jgi:hypothetical protein
MCVRGEIEYVAGKLRLTTCVCIRFLLISSLSISSSSSSEVASFLIYDAKDGGGRRSEGKKLNYF